MPPATLCLADRRQRCAQMYSLLERLAYLDVGDTVDQLEHSLQVATCAWRAAAPLDLVLGALMHDVGRLLDPGRHGLASAQLIAPFVSESTYWIIRLHDELMIDLLPPEPGLVTGVDEHRSAPWFEMARVFAYDWDRHGFMPDGHALPLEFFRPLMLDACLGGGAGR
jgi:predicted HD phosphohydrolase